MDESYKFMEETEQQVERAQKLLPAWFVGRMMTDSWSFGLLLDTGHVLCIETIASVRAGLDGVWIDVEMLDSQPFGVGGLPQELQSRVLG